jgi:pimeloyl-ACP methyl ester carboxylesterase
MALALFVLGANAVVMPATNPQGTPNRLWGWRGQQIRYQALGDERLPADAPSVVFVHGLFVNADHFRNNLPALAEAGYRAYAIDLLGYGYSSKPFPTGPEAAAISGETRRDLSTLPLADLFTAAGARRPAVPIEQRHPVSGSCYNFFTWSEQLTDFVEQARATLRVLQPVSSFPPTKHPPPYRANRSAASLSPIGQVVCCDRVTLVCNSIGCISALQAAVDRPRMVDGVMIVNPNFRELHVAELPDLLRPLVKPAVAALQGALRSLGQGLFDMLAKPDTVKQILLEPYYDPKTVRADSNSPPPRLSPMVFPFHHHPTAAASPLPRPDARRSPPRPHPSGDR